MKTTWKDWLTKRKFYAGPLLLAGIFGWWLVDLPAEPNLTILDK